VCYCSPQIGHQYHETSWELENTIAIVVSHSGGTFGPLAVSNLLQGFTKNLFVITSEWDTQIGKQLRQLAVPNSWELKASIFSTNIGMRPAEPCTISVAATHQLLTEILIYRKFSRACLCICRCSWHSSHMRNPCTIAQSFLCPLSLHASNIDHFVSFCVV
jgi:hypothetical protein